MNVTTRKLSLTTLAVILIAAGAVPAFASTTAWQEIAPDVQARLVSGDHVNSENVLHLGLEIQMSQDTKTYWRVPGDSGIPAQFDWRQTDNFDSATVHWPLPERDIEASGTLSYVYHGDLIIPLDIQLHDTSASVEIGLDLIMGICSDICVPVSVSFNHMVQMKKKDVAQSARIAVAHAQVPLAWPAGQAAPIEQLGISNDGTLVTFRLTSDMIDPNHLIIEPLRDGWFIGRPDYDAGRNTWQAALYGYGQTAPLSPTDIRYVFDTRDGPYEFIAP